MALIAALSVNTNIWVLCGSVSYDCPLVSSWSPNFPASFCGSNFGCLYDMGVVHCNEKPSKCFKERGNMRTLLSQIGDVAAARRMGWVWMEQWETTAGCHFTSKAWWTFTRKMAVRGWNWVEQVGERPGMDFNIGCPQGHLLLDDPLASFTKQAKQNSIHQLPKREIAIVPDASCFSPSTID